MGLYIIIIIRFNFIYPQYSKYFEEDNASNIILQVKRRKTWKVSGDDIYQTTFLMVLFTFTKRDQDGYNMHYV